MRHLRRVRRGRALLRAAGRRARVLTLANQYPGAGGVPEVTTFAAEVEALSGGALRVAVLDAWTSSRDRDEEGTVLRDLAEGVVDLGWVGTRAVGATFGPSPLDALQAPLLFERVRDVVRLVAHGGADAFMEPLPSVGLVGLAVFPGELRRPFGVTRPLVSADDWSGATIRTHKSLPGFATVRALGATPVLRSRAELGGDAPPRVDGMELDGTSLVRWKFGGWLTANVALWPRTLLLAAGARRWRALRDADRRILRAAAARATAYASEALLQVADAERAYGPQVRLVHAGEHALEELRQRLDVVYGELRSRPETAGALQRLLARDPGPTAGRLNRIG